MNKPEKITVSEFLSTYDKMEPELKEAYLKASVIKKYMNYMDKTAMAHTILTLSSINKENGTVELISPKRYVLYAMFLINSYTNIEINFNKMYEEFDALNEAGLIERFLDSDSEAAEIIPSREIAECKMISDLVLSDLMTNKYENHVFLAEQIGIITSVLKDKLEESFIQLKQMSEKIESKV